MGRASVKCNDLSVVHQVLGAFLPSAYKLDLVAGEQDSACATYVEKSAEANNLNLPTNIARCLMPGFWGMAPEKRFIGADFNGFPTQRIQMEGVRDVLVVPPPVWGKFFDQRGQARNPPPP